MKRGEEERGEEEKRRERKEEECNYLVFNSEASSNSQHTSLEKRF
jgi:hypothetical protein